MGAYEVGVVRALFEGASPATGGVPLAPRIFTGTSVGAYNAAFLAQSAGGGAGGARRLEEIWRQRVANTPTSCGNGVYRLRADPLRWLEPGCLAHPVDNLLATAGDAVFWARYGLVRGLNFLTADEPLRVRFAELFDFGAVFSEAPLLELIVDTLDLGRLAASPAELWVAATNWHLGDVRVFGKEQMLAGVGLAAVQASTAIPGIFPPVPIDGQPYVDGGLVMNTPIKPAIDAGADVLHVVYVDPRVADIPAPDLPNTADAFYRIYVIAIADHFHQDVGQAQLVNEDRELAARLGRAAGGGPGLRRIQRVLEHQRRGEPYRPLIIHQYRPRLPLGGLEGLLDFRERHLDGLIAQGYADALEHDCADSQCVLPPDLAAEAGLPS